MSTKGFLFKLILILNSEYNLVRFIVVNKITLLQKKRKICKISKNPIKICKNYV